MANVLIGIVATLGFLFLVNFVKKRKLRVLWWQWVLVILEILYIILVIEVIIEFISEGSARGALVMGILMGFIAVVGSVLLGRFVFLRKTV